MALPRRLKASPARSRLLLFALATTASVFALDRAAADCVLTTGPGSADAPQSGARVLCEADRGVEDTPVTAAAGSTGVRVDILSGATFTADTPYVTIRSDSRIENGASLASTVDNSSIFDVLGPNSTVVNTGTLTMNTRGQAIQIDGGSGSVIHNLGFIRADSIDSRGIQILNSNNVTIINDGEITSRPATGAAFGIVMITSPGQSSRTVNYGLIEAESGVAFIASAFSGNDRLENFGQLRSLAGSASAFLGAGDDTYVVGGTSSFNTFIDGGLQTDTIAFGVDAGSLNVSQIGAGLAYRNFERLEKIGAADWTLTGTNADALPVTVSAGRLFVDGTMANSTVSVLGGATLGGAGTVGPITVAANGTLAPGGRTAIGTLTTSSATIAAGSRFNVRVDDQGNSDRLQVNGTATVNGGTVNVDVDATRGYLLDTRYRILTANTVAGAGFQDATAPSTPPLLEAVLSNDATNIYVALRRATQDPDPQDPQDPQDPPPPPPPPPPPNQPPPPNDPDPPDDPTPPVLTLDRVGRTWNQISTGRAIETQGLRGPLLPRLLVQPTIPDVLLALDLLSGEAYASSTAVAAGDAETIHRTLLTRLRTLDPLPSPAASTAPMAFAPTAALPAMPAPARSLGIDLWGQAFGSWGRQGGDYGLGLASIDKTTGGLILGAETAFDTAWRIGMAGAYTHTSFDVTGRLSSGGIDSYHGALYGAGSLSGFNLRGGATYARHEIDVDRHAAFVGFSGAAQGDMSLDSAGLFAEIGYPVRFGRFTAEPLANLSYLHTGAGSFAEEGGAMALNGATRGFDTVSSTLGLRLSGDLLGDGRFTAHSVLGWRHAFGDRLPLTVNQFAAGGDPFLIVGTPADRDSLIVETGLDWAMTAAATLGLRYDGQFGESSQSQSIRGQLSARF